MGGGLLRFPESCGAAEFPDMADPHWYPPLPPRLLHPRVGSRTAPLCSALAGADRQAAPWPVPFRLSASQQEGGTSLPSCRHPSCREASSSAPLLASERPVPLPCLRGGTAAALARASRSPPALSLAPSLLTPSEGGFLTSVTLVKTPWEGSGSPIVFAPCRVWSTWWPVVLSFCSQEPSLGRQQTDAEGPASLQPPGAACRPQSWGLGRGHAGCRRPCDCLMLPSPGLCALPTLHAAVPPCPSSSSHPDWLTLLSCLSSRVTF